MGWQYSGHLYKHHCIGPLQWPENSHHPFPVAVTESQTLKFPKREKFASVCIHPEKQKTHSWFQLKVTWNKELATKVSKSLEERKGEMMSNGTEPVSSLEQNEQKRKWCCPEPTDPAWLSRNAGSQVPPDGSAEASDWLLSLLISIVTCNSSCSCWSQKQKKIQLLFLPS